MFSRRCNNLLQTIFMFNKILPTVFLACSVLIGYAQRTDSFQLTIPFKQETHSAFRIGGDPKSNEIRSIAVDSQQNIWIATADGVFQKMHSASTWKPIITGDDRGPAYSVSVDAKGIVLLGTWNGIYTYQEGVLRKIEGPKPPISIVCSHGDETYSLGPHGIWKKNGSQWVALSQKISRAVRSAVTDGKGALWVATDVGLYFLKDGKSQLFQSTDDLISCYARALSYSPDGKLWVGVMGGVSIRDNQHQIKTLTTADGLSSAIVRCISQSPEGVMWVGTDVGVVRYDRNFAHTLLFSKRWLTDNQVNAIAFDSDGNAWIGTAKGVSCILSRKMTLADKAAEFYGQLMRKHIRAPWTCGILRLEVAGDTTTWHNSDDDNDGEYTGGYLAMESFRYAVTKDEDARIKARKAFDFLCLLQEVTGTKGFFARSIVPVDWIKVNDPNRHYDEKQLAEELVKDPRYKPVEQRWHKSADGKWMWKGDTSSDEMDGHLMGYFFYYEYAANEEERILVRNQVRKLVDGLMANNYNLVDVDGTHTHWGVWSPDQLNRDPDWAPEKSLNSFELLVYLKLAAHLTGESKYEKEYRRLIDQEGYLKNTAQLNKKNPAWQIYFDRTLEGYLFPILLKYEQDPELKKFYRQLIDEWIKKQEAGENLINNLIYELSTGRRVNAKQTMEFLREAPLDLVDWRIDHTLREDVKLVRSPILEEIQISELPPPAIRSTVRWDKNPWAAVHGDPHQVREPVFWLWPYWMARYLEKVKSEE